MKKFISLLMLFIFAVLCMAPSVITSPPGTTSVIAAWHTNEVWVSARGKKNGLSTVTNGGMPFGPDTVGTKTHGIQEAIDSFSRGSEYGPKITFVSIRLNDGDYFFTNNIYYSNNFTYGISIRGNSPMTSRMIYAGAQQNTNLIWFRGGGNPNLTPPDISMNLPGHVWMENVALSSINEGLNNLLCITNVSGFYINDCRFVSWSSMTNKEYGSAASVASINNYPGPQGLVGIVAGNVNDHWGIVNNCSFQGLASGGHYYTDHLIMHTVKFAEVGFVQGLNINNSYPTTSPFSMGAAIVRNPGLDTHITDAHCYGSRIGLALLNYGAGAGTDKMILDGFETEGGEYDFVAFTTNNCGIYLKDQRIDGTFGKISTNGAGVFSLASSPLEIYSMLYVIGNWTAPIVRGDMITNNHAVPVTLASTLTLSALTSSRFVNITGGALNTGAQPSSTLRGSLNDETGTGSAVFATAPTFPTTVAIGTNFAIWPTNQFQVAVPTDSDALAVGTSGIVRIGDLMLSNNVVRADGSTHYLSITSSGVGVDRLPTSIYELDVSGDIRAGGLLNAGSGTIDSKLSVATSLAVGTNSAHATNVFQVAVANNQKAFNVGTDGRVYLTGYSLASHIRPFPGSVIALGGNSDAAAYFWFTTGSEFVSDGGSINPSTHLTGGAIGSATKTWLRGHFGALAIPQLAAIPTNAIVEWTGTATNWTLCNLPPTIGGGGPTFVATNTSAAGSFLLSRPTLTVTTYP